jgi:hypothetical protein
MRFGSNVPRHARRRGAFDKGSAGQSQLAPPQFSPNTPGMVVSAGHSDSLISKPLLSS